MPIFFGREVQRRLTMSPMRTRDSRKTAMACVFLASVFLMLALEPVLAQGSREQADKRDVRRQEFLQRLPLVSTCRAEVAGGVVLPEGEAAWRSGSFEVEPEDDFQVLISRLEQLPPQERETCEAQGRGLEHDDTRRLSGFEEGSLVCMQRVYADSRRLPQTLACRLSTLLTQPVHLRCRNLDPILDPDGIYVAPNLMAVITLPQAVMTKGRCRAADSY